jgi:hypothetical protein
VAASCVRRIDAGKTGLIHENRRQPHRPFARRAQARILRRICRIDMLIASSARSIGTNSLTAGAGTPRQCDDHGLRREVSWDR